MRLRDLNGKKVLVWGSGREATAFVNAVEQVGVSPKLTIADERLEDGASVGPYPVQLLTDALLDEAEVIIRSPGVSRYRPEIQHALSRGVPITTATGLWFGEDHAPVVGVTGTKGKSTTSSLIAHLLNGLGIRAQLAGNIGRSPIDLIGEPQPDWWVIELSSFQSSDLGHSPDIGVLTNLSPEHLDWHQTFENYVADKLRMFDHSPKVVVNVADEKALEYAADINTALACTDAGVHCRDGVFWLGDVRLFDRNHLELQGPHNEELLCLALTAIAETGVDIVARAPEIAESVSSFRPLPHRLNPVGEYKGVLYVNDSLSTTPVASIAAMRAFAGRPTTLLVGGFDRGLDYTQLAEFVRDRPDVFVVTMPDSGPRIAAAIREIVPNGDEMVREADDLMQAIALASEITSENGVVLLSPAAPSFGRFKDYAERGDAFAQEVARLSVL